MPARFPDSPDPEVSSPFEKLVQDIKTVLGPSSGIDSADVDPLELQELMKAYQSEEKDWIQYAWKDKSRPYTRNLVDSGNGKSNLLILVWTPGGHSPVHDHANAHCVMKILRGSLKETLYDWPEQKGSPMRTTRETVFAENEVTYMSDKLGLHRVSNPDPEEFAVSLHRRKIEARELGIQADRELVYTPPNAAKFGCYMFDEKNGQSIHISQCSFFSEFGKKI